VARGARELEETARVLGFSLGGTEETVHEIVDTQARLEREMRSTSMLLASLWSLTRARDEAAIAEIVFRALASLFHVDAALYFSYAASSDALRCVAFSRRSSGERLGGLVVNRAHSRSAVAEASRTNAVQYAQGPSETAVDDQMRHLMGVEGLACYPLAARGQTVGALVVGIGDGKGEALRRREKPLLLLAGEAALALQADRLRERELDLVRIERVAAAQLVADRVVHEVRSPLAAIKNSVGALQAGATSTEARAILSAVSGEVDRAARLLGGLSRLSEPDELELSDTDVGAVVASFLPVLQKAPEAAHVSITVSSEASLPPVRADADCIKQILSNLVRNAAEASPKGGTVAIRTERDGADGARAVRLVVEDNGPGVPEAILGRLFQPFASTRGGHRGLGLSIVLSLSRRLGGDVRHEPNGPSGGARFVVSLPSL
jgi:signal transduction histidine kinase